MGYVFPTLPTVQSNYNWIHYICNEIYVVFAHSTGQWRLKLVY